MTMPLNLAVILVRCVFSTLLIATSYCCSEGSKSLYFFLFLVSGLFSFSGSGSFENSMNLNTPVPWNLRISGFTAYCTMSKVLFMDQYTTILGASLEVACLGRSTVVGTFNPLEYLAEVPNPLTAAMNMVMKTIRNWCCILQSSTTKMLVSKNASSSLTAQSLTYLLTLT